MKILVIGNGVSVLNHRFGSLIDTFDEVVRFNKYVIDGYEEIVGTKTTIWFRNSGNDMPYRDTSQFKQVILQAIEFPRQWTDLSVFTLYPCVDADTLRAIRLHVDAPHVDLSTGIQALGFMVRNYGRIFIHGFDSFQPPSLYYQPNIQIPLTHSPRERQYIDYLKSQGSILELKDYADKLTSTEGGWISD